MGLSTGGLSKAPTGSVIPTPERPGSALRTSANSTMSSATGSQSGGIMGSIGKPPSTAMRGPGQAPPGTAYKRTGTGQGRPGTGQGQTAAAVRGSPVQVDNRPITQHGVGGIVSKAAGGGRQVLDKAYFLNELRQKRNEIINVTTAMTVRCYGRICAPTVSIRSRR
jgi:intraflagellar transport protein 74